MFKVTHSSETKSLARQIWYYDSMPSHGAV